MTSEGALHRTAATVIGMIDGTSLDAPDLRHLMWESRLQGRAASMELDDVGQQVATATATLRPKMKEAMSRTIEVASARFATERIPQVGDG